MDHAKVAGEVVEAVGGASNISAAAHCATRLRLVIADESKINQQALDDNEDLKGTFAAGGMFQIIVGPRRCRPGLRQHGCEPRRT